MDNRKSMDKKDDAMEYSDSSEDFRHGPESRGPPGPKDTRLRESYHRKDENPLKRPSSLKVRV